MSEIRTSRTKKVNVETPDQASTVSLTELLGEVLGAVAAGIGLLVNEARNAALLNEKPVPDAYRRATVSASGPLAVLRPQAEIPVNVASSRIAGAFPSVMQTELRAIAAAAPYVTRSKAHEISALAKSALTLPQGTQQFAAMAALRDAATMDFDTVTADTVLTRITSSLAEMKFTPVSVKAESGYVLARQGEHGPQIRVDVRRATGGGVEIETDADGFQANSCQTALDQLEAKLKGKGVHLQGGFRRPKRNRYAAIRQAVRQR